MNDYYFSINREDSIELKFKGSRFIGRSFKTDSLSVVESKLQEIRKQEYSATHNCYGWTYGLFNEKTFKYSDDGEPSGTAGKPIYDHIEGNNLSNALIVVTRYFGGTKLGTGGLVKAYSETTKEVISLSGIKKLYLTDLVKVDLDFTLYNQLLNQMPNYEATVTGSEFSDHVKLEISIRKSKSEMFIKMITDLSGGKAIIEKK
ncbi:MAG: hypothetical protein DRP35_01290 [Candidatus Zixiibacteriota bacterium]|nr:MAG: hypothetical protein DRP35_01290 [candidate division Zixibacteria bacterium]